MRDVQGKPTACVWRGLHRQTRTQTHCTTQDQVQVHPHSTRSSTLLELQSSLDVMIWPNEPNDHPQWWTTNKRLPIYVLSDSSNWRVCIRFISALFQDLSMWCIWVSNKYWKCETYLHQICVWLVQFNHCRYEGPIYEICTGEKYFLTWGQIKTEFKLFPRKVKEFFLQNEVVECLYLVKLWVSYHCGNNLWSFFDKGFKSHNLGIYCFRPSFQLELLQRFSVCSFVIKFWENCSDFCVFFGCGLTIVNPF